VIVDDEYAEALGAVETVTTEKRRRAKTRRLAILLLMAHLWSGDGT